MTMQSPYFESVPSPGQWLERQLQDFAIPHTRVAHQCYVAPSQLTNRLKGRDPIPQADMLLYLDLLPPGEIRDEGEMLHQIHCIATTLEKRATKLLGQKLLNPSLYPVVLTREAERLARQGVRTTAALPFYKAVRDIVKYAPLAFGAFSNVIREESDSLVTEHNAVQHVRFPMAQLYGALLQAHTSIPAMFRKNVVEIQGAHRRMMPRLIEPLVLQVKGLLHRRPMDRLQAQAALYLLTRFGQDPTVAEDALYNENMETRRMAYCGLCRNGENADQVERFLYALNKDNELAYATMVFDAMHYGDADIGPDGTVGRMGGNLSNVLAHAARHYTTTVHPQWAELAVFKTIKALQLMGREHILTTRVQNALEAMVQCCEGKPKKSAQEKELIAILATIKERKI